MPLTWIIDSRMQWLAVSVEGCATRADFEEFLEAAVGARALSYRTLIDGTDGWFVMAEPDVLAVAVQIQVLREAMTGPLAVVLSRDDEIRLARTLGILATAPRPMRMFTGRLAAKRWLAQRHLADTKEAQLEARELATHSDLRRQRRATHSRPALATKRRHGQPTDTPYVRRPWTKT
jgi:hypothetical protein